MKRIILMAFLVLFVNVTVSAFNECFAQQFYYYNTPEDNNYYNYDDYNSYGDNGFSFPNGSYNYQYYNGADLSQMMQELNQIFGQYFSQGYPYDNGYNSQFYNFGVVPQMPGYSNPYNFGNQNNQFMPKVPDIAPAPSYKDAPDIYY